VSQVQAGAMVPKLLIVTFNGQEWQQGVAEALKANLLNGSTSPVKSRPSSAMSTGKQSMQVRVIFLFECKFVSCWLARFACIMQAFL
jgi:hypothetical protein